MINFLLSTTNIDPIKITDLGLYSDWTIRDSSGDIIGTVPEDVQKQLLESKIDIWKKRIVPAVHCDDCDLYDGEDYCQYAGMCCSVYSDNFHCKYFKRKTEDGNL